MINFLAFFSSAIISVILTILIKKVALKLDITDKPGPERKIQAKPVPLMGGLGIFLAFFAVVFYLSYFTNFLINSHLLLKHIWTLFIAGAILMIGGIWDDKKNLKAGRQFIFPILAVLAVVAGGIGVDKVTNPLGGLVTLNQYQWIIFWFHSLPYKITLPADIFTVVWLLGMMYTTKILDGLDGLVTGLGAIGSIIIFLLSTTTKYFQPETALLAITFAGAALGFLIFNFHPAKIFLGEGGSLFVGFILGILSIISGGKIATALLIMSIPILDIIWVVLRRAMWEKKDPFHTSDKKHLHFRLLDAGLSHRQAVIVFYVFAAGFGSLTLFLQSRGKLIALAIIVIWMALFAAALVFNFNKKTGVEK